MRNPPPQSVRDALEEKGPPAFSISETLRKQNIGKDPRGEGHPTIHYKGNCRKADHRGRPRGGGNPPPFSSSFPPPFSLKEAVERTRKDTEGDGPPAILSIGSCRKTEHWGGPGE